MFLEYLASGMSVEEVLADFPDLTAEDIRACLAFAAGAKGSFGCASTAKEALRSGGRAGKVAKEARKNPAKPGEVRQSEEQSGKIGQNPEKSGGRSQLGTPMAGMAGWWGIVKSCI